MEHIEPILRESYTEITASAGLILNQVYNSKKKGLNEESKLATVKLSLVCAVISCGLQNVKIPYELTSKYLETNLNSF